MHLTSLGEGVILLEPGEGLDPTDPDAYLVPLLERLQRYAARRLIYDLQDIAIVDAVYYHWLKSVYGACRAIGVTMVVANVRPETAFALALAIGEDPPFRCARDVDRARMSNLGRDVG